MKLAYDNETVNKVLDHLNQISVQGYGNVTHLSLAISLLTDSYEALNDPKEVKKEGV